MDDMKSLLALILLGSLPALSAFVSLPGIVKRFSLTMGSNNIESDGEHPFCRLPGDPSLILTTNVDLGDKKLDIMKACSKAISKHTGKPESYIAVSITDKADVIFGGSDDPTALGCLYSIGGISTESNGAIQSDVTELLEPHGVKEDRIYINFFDMPRGNVGWKKRTFAG